MKKRGMKGQAAYRGNVQRGVCVHKPLMCVVRINKTSNSSGYNASCSTTFDVVRCLEVALHTLLSKKGNGYLQ